MGQRLENNPSDEAARRHHTLSLHLVPHQPGRDLVATQVAVDGVVAELLAVVSEIRQGVIDLTDLLAVIQTSHFFLHAMTLSLFQRLGDSSSHFFA
jgi:hypothetical protein